jgi:hypothetical protein
MHALFSHNEVRTDSSFSKFTISEIKEVIFTLDYNRPPDLTYASTNAPISFQQLPSEYIQRARRDSSSLLFAVKFIFECDCGSDSGVQYDSDTSSCI